MKMAKIGLVVCVCFASLACEYALAEDAPKQIMQEVQHQASVRIKDLVEMRGVRSNSLVGFGLVVGLPGTGDSKQSLATNRAAATMLTRLGQTVKPQEVTTKNIAAVIVNAELPAFAKIGDKISIRMSSIGDASSLEGGTLLLTPLSAVDDNIYAAAQGSVSMGTAMAGIEGGGGGGKSLAPKTVGMAFGATVEKEFEQTFLFDNKLELSLKQADFTTAIRVVKAINEYFSDYLAEATNSGTIKVRIPAHVKENNFNFPPVAFVAALEQIKVEPDSKAIVIINERTGTVISGADVIIGPVGISHGNLQIAVADKVNYVGEIKSNSTVGELVKALNALGAGPKDLVSILQALEAAKALRAELKLM